MSLVASPSTSYPQLPLPPYPVWRFSVDEYHRLLENGILTEDSRVELLEGWIVPKLPHSPAHDRSIELTDEALRRLLPPLWRIRIQSVITTDDSEPEPDLAVVRGSIRGAGNRHPAPSEIGQLVEVSESTLASDRIGKGRLYAQANIPIYWIINLVEAHLEVYTDPSGPAAPATYRRRQDYLPGDLVPVVLDGQPIGSVAVSDLLP